MLFKVLARLGLPPKIVNLVRVFHENVTLEVDLDDDGNTIIIKDDIGVKQGDTLAPVLFLCYIQAALETLFPKFEAAGIANAIQGTSQVHKNAVLIEKGKQLYLEEARRRAPSLTFQATVRFLGTSERMSLRREVRPT